MTERDQHTTDTVTMTRAIFEKLSEKPCACCAEIYKDEIARLRAALQAVVDHPGSFPRDIARAALNVREG